MIQQPTLKGFNMAHSVYHLEQHLKTLMANHHYYFQAGDWERVDFISLCIDDTGEQLERAKKLAESSGDDGDNDEGDYHPYGDPQV